MHAIITTGHIATLPPRLEKSRGTRRFSRWNRQLGSCSDFSVGVYVLSAASRSFNPAEFTCILVQYFQKISISFKEQSYILIYLLLFFFLLLLLVVFKENLTPEQNVQRCMWWPYFFLLLFYFISFVSVLVQITVFLRHRQRFQTIECGGAQCLTFPFGLCLLSPRSGRRAEEQCL